VSASSTPFHAGFTYWVDLTYTCPSWRLLDRVIKKI
jgi:hypothetical protein